MINRTTKEGQTMIALYRCNCKKGQESTSIKMVNRDGMLFPKCNHCKRFGGIQTKFIEV